MNWLSRAPKLQSAFTSQRTAAPVPDIDVLRRAALQASWRRDRRIARRRTAVRWALWYGVRGLPLLMVAAAVAVWLLVPREDHSRTPVTPPALSVQPNPPHDEPGIQLKLESPFRPTQPVANVPAAAANLPGAVAPAIALPLSQPLSQPVPLPLPQPSPQLKTDNWLHSKEP